jgi:hypothetical protein
MAAVARQLLTPVVGLADQRQKTDQYKAALHQILESKDPEACKEFVNHSAFARSVRSVEELLLVSGKHNGCPPFAPLSTCSVDRRGAARHQPPAAAVVRPGRGAVAAGSARRGGHFVSPLATVTLR